MIDLPGSPDVSYRNPGARPSCRAQGIEEKQERQREKERAAEAARQEKKRLTRRSGTGGSAASPLDVSEPTAPPRKVSRDVLIRLMIRVLGLGLG